jgi:hypothetical protein
MRFAIDDGERQASGAARELFSALAGADRAAIERRLGESGWLSVVQDAGAVVALLVATEAGWCGLEYPFTEMAIAAPAAAPGLGVAAPVGVAAATDGLRGREPLRFDHGKVTGAAWPVVATAGVTSWLALAGDGLFVVHEGRMEPMQPWDPSVELWRVAFDGAAAERLPDRALYDLLDWGAASAAAEMLGAAQRLLDMSVEHAKHRAQFGRPVGTFQAVKHHCANMHVLVETMRASVWGAAAALASGEPAGKAVSIAKSYCGPAARRVASTALQVHGGIGFTWEHPLHRHLKRIERLAMEFGDARWHRARLLRALR